MRYSLKFLILSIFLFFIQGCTGVTKYDPIDVKESLFATIKEKTRGYVIVSLSNKEGDIDLRNLAPTSNKIIEKYCGTIEDYSCMNNILASIDINHNRRAILESYNDLLNLNTVHLHNLDALYNKKYPSYIKDKERLSLEYRINDMTKIYEGEKINSSDLVFIGLNDLHYPNSVDHIKDINEIFPLKIASYDQTLSKLKRKLINVFNEEERVYKQTIAHLSNHYPIQKAKKLSQGKYTFSAKHAINISRTAKKSQRVVLNIIGKDLHAIFPDPFKAKNRDIEASFNKNDTTIRNLSDKSIYLNSITFFYNGSEKKILLGDKFSFSKIEQGSSVTAKSLLFFSTSFANASTFNAVTKQKAKYQKVLYGAKIEYKKGGSKKIYKMLYKNKVTLYKMVSGW